MSSSSAGGVIAFEELRAVVTWNLYGTLVLNAANAMFIDIDLEDKGASCTGTPPGNRIYPALVTLEPISLQQFHPDVAPILALHDRLTGVKADRPLA